MNTHGTTPLKATLNIAYQPVDKFDFLTCLLHAKRDRCRHCV